MHRNRLEIRLLQKEAWLDGARLPLRVSEFRLLTLLAGRPNRAFSRAEIIETLHGTRFASTERAVDVVVCALRKKLGPAARRVQTVRGGGYRFGAANQ